MKPRGALGTRYLFELYKVTLYPARPGAVRPPDSEDKIRRTAEREGRRRARRLKREAGGARHHRDGDSSDDELPPAERHHDTDERGMDRGLGARRTRMEKGSGTRVPIINK